MSLSRAVSIQDEEFLYRVIKGGGSANWIFIDRVPGILDETYNSLSSSAKTVDEVIAELPEVFEEAGKIKFPLPVTAAALQVYQLAAMRGLGWHSDSFMVEIWNEK